MSFQTMGKIFLRLCESVDSPIALGAYLRYKFCQKELATLRVDPRDYNDPAAFRRDYLVATFLRKWKGLDTGIDTADAAFQKFIASEELCSLTNKRLTSLAEDPYRSRAEAILHSASRKISAILGEFSLSKVLRRCEWTVGATLEIPKRRSFVDTKMNQLPITVTRRALPYIKLELEHDPRWFEALTGVYPEGPYEILPSLFKVVGGNKVTTVPKDSTTDRVIAVEPRANIFLQKGVGNYMRARLKRFRVDLSKQEINQAWASMALDLDLCTIDLSSASDTIAKELVYQLLPVDWAVYLDDIRSPIGLLPGNKFQKYEKFSSMGNGFTFELESMVFFALCEATQDYFSGKDDWRLTSVYGDDLVVPKWSYPHIVDMLTFCGFEVNSKKSYASGLFYESCGKHYFGGEDVTPIYQKELLDEVEAMRMGNRLFRWSTTHLDQITRPAWHTTREFYRTLLSCELPSDADGDDGWLVPHLKMRYDPNHGYRCRVIRFTKRRFPAQGEALLAYSLRKLSWRSNSIWAPKPGIHYEGFGKISLEDRIGFLFVDVTDASDEFEVESARFVFGRRWVHTNVEVGALAS